MGLILKQLSFILILLFLSGQTALAVSKSQSKYTGDALLNYSKEAGKWLGFAYRCKLDKEYDIREEVGKLSWEDYKKFNSGWNITDDGNFRKNTELMSSINCNKVEFEKEIDTYHTAYLKNLKKALDHTGSNPENEILSKITVSTQNDLSEFSSISNSQNDLMSLSDSSICDLAIYKKASGYFAWRFSSTDQKYVKEANRRGLSCGLGGGPPQTISSNFSTINLSSKNNFQKVSYNFELLEDKNINIIKNKIIENNYFPVNESKYWINLFSDKAEIREIKGYSNRFSSRLDGNVRVIDGVRISSKIIGYGIVLANNSNLPICYARSEHPKLTFTIKCENGVVFNGKYKPYGTGKGGSIMDGNDNFILGPSLAYVKNENLSKDFFKKLEFKLNSKHAASSVLSLNKNNSLALQEAQTEAQIALSKVQKAEQKAADLEQQLAKLQSQQKKKQQQISQDNQIPLINAMAYNDTDTNAIIQGVITDNVEVAEVTVDNQLVPLNTDGSFQTNLYIPRNGKTVEIVAIDLKGNKAVKTIQLNRNAIEQASSPVFASLNPSGKRVQPNPNALALIIGVADYEKTPAKAMYADSDAQIFYDYAMLKLGIPSTNIMELVNDKADESEILLAVKDWIARSTKQGESDIYIFFAGHGLASSDGENMYLLPYDGSPRLLEDTAILRERLFKEVSSSNPRSVTVFLDTCYSGTTRGTDMLIASRPIAIIAKEQAIPDNFTVFTAAAGDQTAKPLEEAKHGLFSYFLMKGMEGEADSNKDNTITAGELHSYVEQNVIQQSSGSQTPELQGDANRVLVQFQ